MDSPAPSPTIIDLLASIRIEGSSPASVIDSASPTTIDIDIDTASSTIDIDINTASPTIAGIAVPTVVYTTSPTTIVNITALTAVDTASATIGESTPVFAIDPIVTTTVDPISSLTGSTSARTGGFDMAFGLFNFHVDDNGAA
jgi:hypothetical protein